MKKLILALSCSLLLFVGCHNRAVPPRFMHWDKVEVVGKRTEKSENTPDNPIGIVSSRTRLEGGEFLYTVYFVDGKSYQYSESELNLIERFSFTKD